MKKIVAVTVLTCFLFFSCRTTKSESPTNQKDFNSTTSLQESESENLSQQEELDQNQNDENQEQILQPQEEKVTEDYFEEPKIIPEEEKIPEEELDFDLELLEEIPEQENEFELEEILQEQEQETEPEEITEEQENQSDLEIENQEQQEIQNTTLQEITELPEILQNQSPEELQNEETSLNDQQDAKLAAQDINDNTEISQEPIPSRTVEIKNNQYLDINYPGTGWVYLGELEGENLLIFNGRKIDANNTTFTLRSKKSGTTVLHFYKNDNLSGNYIEDYIEVSVEKESATDNNHIIAPEYAKTVPPVPQKLEQQNKNFDFQEDSNSQDDITSDDVKTTSEKSTLKDSNSDIQTNIQNADGQNSLQENQNQENAQIQNETSILPNNEQNSSTENSVDFFELAQTAYNNKDFPQALTYIKQFLTETSDRFDQGLFLEAQILEAPSSVQNIKEAIQDYDAVVNNWPASRLWKKANERSIYLKRFYIDIR